MIENMTNEEVAIVNNKLTLTAIGLGAAYLMKNKDARKKLMKQFESFTGMGKNA